MVKGEALSDPLRCRREVPCPTLRYIKINKFRTDLISDKLRYVRNFFCDVFIKSLSDKQRKLSENKPSEIFSSEILSSEIY